MEFKKPEIVVCDCHSIEHQIILNKFKDEYGVEVYIQVHLAKKSFLDRLIYGIKYIFGYQCMYGAFDEFIVTKNNYEVFKELVNYIEKNDVTERGSNIGEESPKTNSI